MADGGKNKKYGRNAKRPSAVRYKAENKCAKNKARNIKAAEKQADKILNVPHGTARRERRANLQRIA